MHHARGLAVAILAIGLLSPTILRAQEAIAPGDSAKVATVEKLLVASDMKHLYDQSVEASLAAQMRANPQLAPFEGTMREFMTKYASYEAMKPDLIRIYRETLTES